MIEVYNQLTLSYLYNLSGPDSVLKALRAKLRLSRRHGKIELVFGGFDHPNPLWKKGGGEIVEEMKVGITGWTKGQCFG